MRKSKVLIASCYYQPNYGSKLQAFALQEKIRALGFDCENICYENVRKDIEKKKIYFYLLNYRNFTAIINQIKRVDYAIKKKIVRKINIFYDQRKRCLDRFEKENMIVSRKLFWDELTSYCKDYEAVIVGSDQLWLPSNIAGNFFTLSFVPDEVRKYSYATSFGMKLPSTQETKRSLKFLERFNKISVREKNAKQLIEKVVSRNVTIVCDPVMLLSMEEWNKLTYNKRIIENKYIFCYFLGNNIEQRKWVKKLSEKTGHQIIALLHLDEYISADEKLLGEYSLYGIGPFEFVNLIKNAEYICTDSFHGTVFSAVFHKMFFSFKRYKETSKVSTNSRVEELLVSLECKQRMISEKKDVEDALKMKMEYYKVEQKIEKLREDSISFLSEILNDV